MAPYLLEYYPILFWILKLIFKKHLIEMESNWQSYFEIQVKFLSFVENPGMLCSCI